MTNKQKRSLAYACIIGNLLSSYDDDDKDFKRYNKRFEKLKLRISKGVRKQVMLYTDEAISSVIHDTNKLWKDTINHFEGQKRTIEVSHLVSCLIAYDEVALTKKPYNINPKLFESWQSSSTRKDALELETNNRIIAKYIDTAINKLYNTESTYKVWKPKHTGV